MKKNLTEIVFILDRSGSMGGLESDTIGGFNTMLEKQKDLEGACRLTTVLFDNKYELLHDRIDIQAVNPIGENEYWVRGMTALIDAIGMTVQKIMDVQKNTREEHRADKVIFVIITDGNENASREYKSEQVKKMIEERKEEGWEFVFLGANIDAVETAMTFGINENKAVNYHSDQAGTALNYAVMDEAISKFRSGKIIEDSDFDAIRRYHEDKGGRR